MRLACRMNVKNETACILRAHAERAVSANALVKIYSKLYGIILMKNSEGVLHMLLPQQITKAFNELTEEEAKALLVEIFIARNYSNQEMIMKINEIVERLNIAQK